jgi:DNA helicase-2/ATP-dependent DNA helicase PcrA
MPNIPPIEHFWSILKPKPFTPNPNQEAAIRHSSGPLFLMAGPGSGKTRVLLWRTVNLIVYHDVDPGEIFLATFTEKAARQLMDGLRAILDMITQETAKPYDISKMRIGTVHSICQKLITDRDFSPVGVRNPAPTVMDELGQYFFLHRRSTWEKFCAAAGFTQNNPVPDEEAQQINGEINQYFGGRRKNSSSRHWAVENVKGLFNRFSEESLDPDECGTQDPVLKKLLGMYKAYIEKLKDEQKVDFSLLQSAAYQQICSYEKSQSVIKHIIIDEYQDTNSIQEKIFFALAKGHKNICVVGDDDQALYRFRGATVENLVEFEDRCRKYLGLKPEAIPLDINYRSKQKIVEAYSAFISIPDWSREDVKGKYHRIIKNITYHKPDDKKSVLVSSSMENKSIYTEITELIYRLKTENKISDYNQCAFLFPSLGTTKLQGFVDAFSSINAKYHLEDTPDELKYYAPRAGKFLEVEEALAVWGVLLKIFGRPHFGGGEAVGDLKIFRDWLIRCGNFAETLCRNDGELEKFIAEKQAEIEQHKNDLRILEEATEKEKADIKAAVDEVVLNKLINAPGLSKKAKASINNAYFRRLYRERKEAGNPFTVAYIMSRATSLDWNILDLFYQICGFDYFQKIFDQAEAGTDEGPICNMALVSQYLSRFLDEYPSAISALWLKDDSFQHCLFSSFTFALWRLGESEYEDSEDPFPKGRISFLTIHQSKGLEFPVVVLGGAHRRENRADLKEELVRQLLDKKDGEPLEKIPKFDNMRMFYVALSRAQNLLILPRYSGTASATPEIQTLLGRAFTTIDKYDTSDFDPVNVKEDKLGKTYSYTADFLMYNWCPRQYMVMRKYGFATGKSQTMFFGSLVHQTIEDLHYRLMDLRRSNNG